jgi:preprotein translocase subunit Sec61beta
MRCPYCGREDVPPDATFCVACGGALRHGSRRTPEARLPESASGLIIDYDDEEPKRRYPRVPVLALIVVAVVLVVVVGWVRLYR